MKRKIVFVFVILAVILTACGAKAAYSVVTQSEVPMDYYERGVGGGAADNAGYAAMPTSAPSGLAYDSSAPTVPNTSNQAALQQRMVVMNADLTIVVPDPQAEAEAITRMAQELGGYVTNLQMYQASLYSGGTAPEGTISIRIPQDKLETALARIKANAVEVRSETRSSQDVTSAYVDLESQLTNLEQAEQDLLVIMHDAQTNPGNDVTTRTQDVLNVYNQIVNLRAQIEQIKGQIQYYDDVTATSLINVNLIAEQSTQPIQIGPWSPKGAFNQAVQDLVRFWHNFVEFLIRFAIYVLPVVLLIFGPLALIAWAVAAGLKRRKAKKAKTG